MTLLYNNNPSLLYAIGVQACHNNIALTMKRHLTTSQPIIIYILIFAIDCTIMDLYEIQ